MDITVREELGQRLIALDETLECIASRFGPELSKGEQDKLAEEYRHVIQEHVAPVAELCKTLSLEPFLWMEPGLEAFWDGQPKPTRMFSGLRVFDAAQNKYCAVALTPNTYPAVKQCIEALQVYLDRGEVSETDKLTEPETHPIVFHRFGHVTRKELETQCIDDKASLTLMGQAFQPVHDDSEGWDEIALQVSVGIRTGNLVLCGSLEHQTKALVLFGSAAGITLSERAGEWAVARGIVLPSVNRTLQEMLRLETSTPLAEEGDRALAEEGLGDVFRPCGKNIWYVVFDGVEARLPEKSGMRYIQLLLQQPGQTLGIMQLEEAVTGERAEFKYWRNPGHDPSESPLEDRDKPLPRQDNPEYHKGLRELKAIADDISATEDEMDKARSDSNMVIVHDCEERLAELKRRHETIKAIVSQLHPKREVDDRMDPAIDKMRRRITRAIERSIRHVSKFHAPLGNHLSATIETGLACSYNDTSHSWQTT